MRLQRDVRPGAEWFTSKIGTSRKESLILKLKLRPRNAHEPH